MATNLATRSLIFNVNGADPVFDKLLHQVANMMLAAVAGIAVGNDHRRAELDGRGLFPLRRGRSHPIGPLHFVLVHQGPHPRGSFLGNPIQRVVRQVGARIFRVGTSGRSGPSAEIKNLDALHHRAHRSGRRERPIGNFLFFRFEQLLQVVVHLIGRMPRDSVVLAGAAAERDYLVGGVKPSDLSESWALNPKLGVAQFPYPFDRFGIAPSIRPGNLIH